MGNCRQVLTSLFYRDNERLGFFSLFAEMRAGKRTLLQHLTSTQKKLPGEKTKSIPFLKAPSEFKDLLKEFSFAPKRTPARKAISILTHES